MSVTIADYGVYGSLLMPAYDGAATLNGALTSSATTVAINVPTVAFPSSGEFPIAFSSGEISWVTQGAPAGGVSSATLTIIRGFAGSTQAAQVSSTAITMPIGGGVDFTTKVFFSDISSGSSLNYLSTSSGDTKPQIQITVRDSTGVLQQETKTLNGTTVVTGTQLSNRLEVARLASVTTLTGALTASSVTATVALSSAINSSGNQYVQMAKEILLVSSGMNTSSWTVTRAQMGTTATIHQNGDPVYLLPLGDWAVYDSTAVISAHTAQTGSANAVSSTPPLFKLQSGDGAGVSLGQLVWISSGTGSGQIRTIAATYASSAYGADVVAVSRNWTSVPDNTSVYTIVNGVQGDLSPNQITECRRFTWNAGAPVAGASSSSIFYQKFYAVNNNTSTALTGAQFEIASNTPSLPGSSLLDIAIATSLNDTVTAVNRQTSFSSGYSTFTTQPAYVLMTANSGNMPSGAAPNSSGTQGIEMRLTLPAGTAAYKGAADFRTQGTTV